MQRPSLRRPAPAPSSPRPAPPPPPPHLPRPQSPPLPAALLPPKKRFLRYASTLIPTPPPPTTNAPATSVPPAAEALVSPTPSPLPPVAPPPPKAADPSTPPIPTADAKSPSTPLIPAADTTLPSTMPPSADSAPAAEPAPERKARKRKVIIRKVLVKVPKGTLAARKAAAAAASAASADGAEACKPNETLGDKGCNTGKPNETLGDKGCSHLGCKQGQSSSVRNCKVAAAAAAAREALIKRKQLLLEGRALSTKTAIIDRDAILEGMMEGLLEEPTLARNPATDCSAPVEEGVGMSKAESTSMKEVFVGGLHYDAREEDVRAAYRKAGEITQVRLIQNSQTGKNKGYCFVRYREAAQAKKAVAELGNVKICGKRCRTAAQDVNNIEKKRKKEDVNIKDSLPKPVEKSKQNREQYVSNISQSDMTVAKSETLQIAGDKKSSTNPDLLNIPREQATRRHRQTVLAPIQGHHRTYSGLNRASSTLDNYSSDRTRSHSRPHHGSSTLYYVNSTAFPANAYDFLPASYYGVTRSSVNSQIRRAGPHQPEQTYGGRHY